MIPCFTAQRSILLAGTIAGILLAVPAFAQQPPATAPAATPPGCDDRKRYRPVRR